MMRAFLSHVGIDFFGAQTPTLSLKRPRDYIADMALRSIDRPPPSARRRCMWREVQIAEGQAAGIA